MDVLAYQKDYYRRNTQLVKDRQREYRRKNIDRFRAYQKEYRRNNKERYAAYYEKVRYAKRIEILELAGGVRCSICNFGDWRALQLDHKEGGGGRDREIARSQKKTLEDLRAHPDKYQVLCANCNWIKRYTNNECKKTLWKLKA